jgi:hypothetical protein
LWLHGFGLIFSTIKQVMPTIQQWLSSGYSPEEALKPSNQQTNQPTNNRVIWWIKLLADPRYTHSIGYFTSGKQGWRC